MPKYVHQFFIGVVRGSIRGYYLFVALLMVQLSFSPTWYQCLAFSHVNRQKFTYVQQFDCSSHLCLSVLCPTIPYVCSYDGSPQATSRGFDTNGSREWLQHIHSRLARMVTAEPTSCGVPVQVIHPTVPADSVTNGLFVRIQFAHTYTPIIRAWFATRSDCRNSPIPLCFRYAIALYMQI